MAEHTIHIIHDTFRDKARRERLDTIAVIWTLAIFFLLAFMGAIISKSFKYAFWSLILAVGLFFLGKTLRK